LDTNAVTVNLPATVSFTYDDNGNLLSDGRRLLGYDDENQLITVIVTNGVNSSTLSKFAHDGLGRRRVRTECVWQNGGWATNALVRYVYDGMVVLQERDGNNLPTVTYTRGRDLSGSLQGAGGIGGLLALTVHSSLSTPHLYYHADGNGNVTCLINEKQALVARYVYEPFGNVLSLSGPLAEVNLYRFSSKEAHPVSGLVYYGFRFYDPNLQRWVNRDPIGEEGGINPHQCSQNQPPNGWDTDGLTYRSNLEFLLRWLLGLQPDMVYPIDSSQSREMQQSVGAAWLRDQFYNRGFPPEFEIPDTTFRAFNDTWLNPFTKDFSSTAFQVGGFRGNVTLNSNGTITFCIPNTAGTQSFFYHLVPDMPWKHGPMRTVHQTFQWTEPFDPRRCRRPLPVFPIQQNTPPFIVTAPR